MFVSPSALFLLLVLPLAALLLWRRGRVRRNDLKALAEPALLSVLADTRSERLRFVKAALWLLVVCCAIIALARPVWGVETLTVQTQGVSILMVLDVSTSMAAEDVLPSRLERAKLDARQLIDARVGDEFGLVLFAGDAFVQFPLTVDAVAAAAFLQAATTESLSRQGTATEQALRLALDTFDADALSPAVIILLTDGESHDDQPVLAAQVAAQRGVILHVIGYGTQTGAPIPLRDAAGNVTAYKTDAQGGIIQTRLEETTLSQLADITGGLYRRAHDDPAALTDVLQEIDQLERGTLESRPLSRPVERASLFVALALLLLTVEIFLPERRPSRV